jgi:hypothetical protein
VAPYHLTQRYKHMAYRLDADAQPILAECDLSETAFAWTYLAMTGNGYIGFGQAFFAAAAVGGHDSRMGTVVHELAHLVPGIAADDLFYDIPSMERLAAKEPHLALQNAQSYEYLVEELYDRTLGLVGTQPAPAPAPSMVRFQAPAPAAMAAAPATEAPAW